MTPVQSVERSFQVLQMVAAEPAGISQLARRVDLPTSTVSRLLKTLEMLRAVQRQDDGVYSLGPATLALASRVNKADRLAGVDRGIVRGLATQLGEVTGLSEPAGGDVLYRDQIDCHNEVRVRDWTGERLPQHVVSSGLVFLANASADQLDRYLAGDLHRFTDRTVWRGDDIRDRLIEVRKLGYAWTSGEVDEGINSVAAPLYDGDGLLLGAIHCHGPAYRFPGGADEKVAAAVTHAAARISRNLGWSGQSPAVTPA